MVLLLNYSIIVQIYEGNTVPTKKRRQLYSALWDLFTALRKKRERFIHAKAILLRA